MKSIVSWRDLTRTDVLAIVALMALALALGLFQLDAESVWSDETSSIAIVNRTPADLWRHVTRVELNGIIYYLLLHGWIDVFGQSEVAIRSLSVIFTVAAVPFVYITGRMLFDRRVAFTATLILVTSAFIVAYAQEARTYALALFLTSVATFLFVEGLRRPTWPTWLLYTGVAALSLYAHFFSAFILAAHAASLVFIDYRSIRWRPLLISFALIGVLALPVVRFAAFVENAACRTAWVPPLSIVRVGEVFWEFVGGNVWLLVALGLAVVAAILAVARQPGGRTERWPFVFVLLLIALPVALALATSAIRPLFVTRYMIVAFPGLAYLAAYGLASLRPRLLGTIALIGVIALSGWSLAAYYLDTRKIDYRDVGQQVASVTDRAAAVIMYQRYGDQGHLLTYYLDRYGNPASAPSVVHLPQPTDYLAEGSTTVCPTTPSDAYSAAVEEMVAGLQRSYPRVVMVNGRSAVDPFLPVLVGALESRYREVELFVWSPTPWQPRIELHVYDSLAPTAGQTDD